MKSRARILLSVVFLLSMCCVLPAQTVPASSYSALQWRMIGPFRGGRSIAVAGVPGDGRTFYFGSVDGGIWKTIDAGVTWTPISDREPIASVGALAIAPSDPKIIYAGTGESDIRSALSSGDGVYKSTDGGESWKNVGLRDSWQISRIVVDPNDANVVYVGVLGSAYVPSVERGVYKSTDGGATWKRVLNKGATGGVSDLAIAAGKPNILFAGTWSAHRPPWSAYAPLQGPDGGIFRSTDGGENWTYQGGHGLPGGEWGRVGVAVSPDGQRVYALVDAGKQSGLYRSDDGGDNWTLANSDPRLTSRAWYFNWITVDPNNPDVIYVPNVALYRSEDGGKTISIVRGAPGGDDYHLLWIDPKDSSRIALASDQGTSISLNYGKTWSSWYNQPTAQMYHVAADNEFPYAVYGAQQDSGAASVMSRTDHGSITARDWGLVGGGESGWLALDPLDSNILFATGAYGGVVRYDRRTSFSQDISPWPMPNFMLEIDKRKYRAPWTPMLVFSQADKHALYMGTQYVMKTTDGGLHWEAISPDLTGAAENADARHPQEPLTIYNAKARGYGVVFSIAPSPRKADEIWAGSDTGLLHLTRDGGKNWTNVTPPGLSDWSKIAMIEASRFDDGTAYVAVERHRLGDDKPYLFRTRDYGKTWQPISSGIGEHAFVNAIRQDTQNKNLLFAGTERGAYVSFDEGDHWQPLQLNLPVTSVRDLLVHGDDLIAATHGRGFWILDDFTALRQTSAAPQSAPVLYRPAKATRVDNDGFQGTPLPPEEPAAKNPPDGAILDYVLASDAHDVKLEIVAADGKVVRRFSNAARPAPKTPPIPIAPRWLPKPQLLGSTAGMHRFVWDLRWGSSGSGDDDDYGGFGAPRGPRAVPGTYQVRLTADGTTVSQPLEVAMDPRSSATAKELDEQLRVGRQIFEQARLTRKALAEMTAVRSSLAEATKAAAANPALLSQISAVEKSIAGIESGGREAGAPSMGLSAANTGLMASLRVVGSSDRTIPSQAMDVFRQSNAAAESRLAEWTALKQGDLARLNRALEAAGVKPIAIAEIEQQLEYLMSE